MSHHQPRHKFDPLDQFQAFQPYEPQQARGSSSRSSGSSKEQSAKSASPPASPTVARSSRRKTRREFYTRFSAAEQAMLLDGVRIFGPGRWKKILSSYDFHHKRTAVDLKDKYRNVLRAQERARNNAASASLPLPLAPIPGRDGRYPNESDRKQKMSPPSLMKLTQLLCTSDAED